MATLLLLNGPNLNLLGEREPELYGAEPLAVIIERLREHAQAAGAQLEHFQTNAEHELIARIHAARGRVAAIIINPGAWGHTSLALADALVAVAIPYFEVHLTNVFARGGRRAELLLAPAAAGVLVGCGSRGYDLALAAALARIDSAGG
ncbi:MAG: type II 3-dehydroquinate dehydratase [Gammaproteobacteria bacterium]